MTKLSKKTQSGKHRIAIDVDPEDFALVKKFPIPMSKLIIWMIKLASKHPHDVVMGALNNLDYWPIPGQYALPNAAGTLSNSSPPTWFSHDAEIKRMTWVIGGPDAPATCKLDPMVKFLGLTPVQVYALITPRIHDRLDPFQIQTLIEDALERKTCTPGKVQALLEWMEFYGYRPAQPAAPGLFNV
jgi:hypothetical protein